MNLKMAFDIMQLDCNFNQLDFNWIGIGMQQKYFILYWNAYIYIIHYRYNTLI